MALLSSLMMWTFDVFILRDSLVGSGDNVHTSLVRQSYQLPPGSMVIVMCHDDQRR